MLAVLMIFHIIVTCFMVGVILLQKGEDLGAESVSLRGSGGGQSVFTKLTVIVGAIFMGNCLLMAGLVRLESKVTRKAQSDIVSQSGDKKAENSP